MYYGHLRLWVGNFVPPETGQKQMKPVSLKVPGSNGAVTVLLNTTILSLKISGCPNACWVGIYSALQSDGQPIILGKKT